jgi:uracil-DNA glycosylase family 4
MTDTLRNRVETFLDESRDLYGPVYFKTATAAAAAESESDSAKAPSLSDVSSLDELRALCEGAEELRTDLPGTNLVFGVGNPDADLMLVGEAPGENEDIQGEPFVGKAGQLLTDILKAIRFRREDVYIANILKHRPPNNRDPLPEERRRSLPYLHKQIELVNPKLILCVGKVAGSTLLGLDEKTPLNTMRGTFHAFRERHELMVTFHPAALLRNPAWKKDTWADVQLLRKRYDELGGKP